MPTEQTPRSAAAAPDEVRPGDPVRTACPLCGRDRHRVLPFRYAFKAGWLHGVQCRDCALVFVHPQPAPDEIAALYSEEYFTECTETCGAHGRQAYLEEARCSGPWHRRKARDLDRRLRAQLGSPGRLLEVGCGPGFLLAELSRLGWSVAGLELSEFAAEFAREHFQLDVRAGALAPAACRPETYEAVVMGDVLEHLPDPRESLRAVWAWLRPGGVLAVAVPSTMNTPAARIGQRLYGLRGGFKTLRIAPYHLFEYTPRTLRAMLASAGFHVVELQQSAVPFRRMALRGSWMENAGKAVLQIAVHVTSRCFNRGGDRLLAVARK